jgi:hypothetical protein
MTVPRGNVKQVHALVVLDFRTLYPRTAAFIAGGRNDHL